jgi:hypothetical protein
LDPAAYPHRSAVDSGERPIHRPPSNYGLYHRDVTLIAACAWRHRQGRALVAFADSRLSLQDGSTDVFIKCIGLTRRSVALIAGSSTLPAITALEGARDHLLGSEALSIGYGVPRPSLLEELGEFMRFFALQYGALANVRPVECETILAGYFADESPGLIKVSFAPDRREIAIFRPTRPGFAVVAGGHREFAPLATEAIRRTLATEDGTHLINRTASVFWDAIRHEGLPAAGIGGGINIGVSQRIGGQAAGIWQWPIVQIEGQKFFRGIPIRDPLAEEDISRVVVEHDPHLFGMLERMHSETAFPSTYPDPILVGVAVGDSAPEFRSSNVPEWRLSQAEGRILGCEADLDF